MQPRVAAGCPTTEDARIRPTGFAGRQALRPVLLPTNSGSSVETFWRVAPYSRVFLECIMPHILLIEDDTGRASDPHTIRVLDDDSLEAGRDGPAAALGRPFALPDLISLRLVLPRREGYRVLRTLRDEGVEVPMAIVTTHAGDMDGSAARGAGAGRDTHASSDLLDIVARLEALLDRGRGEPRPEGITQPASERFGDIEVDLASRSVRRNNAPVPLTPLEFDLLHALIERRGAVVSRLELLREVWGYSAGATSRTVDTHIANLRRKLEADPSAPRHILTVWKAGYRLQP